MEIRLNDSNDASIFLDGLRALAAQVVCIGHGLYLFNVNFWNVDFQAISVVVFFLMSGFVIAHVLTSKRNEGFGSYAIDRISRIYTAYLPAVLFVVLIDYWLMSMDRYDYQDFFSLKGIVANLLMMQNHRWPFSAPTLGSGQPFWTVAIEFHIYLFVGAIFFLPKRPLLMAIIAVIFCGPPLYYLFNSIDPGSFAAKGLFGIWLMGFASYFVIKNGYLEKIPNKALVIAGIIALIYYGLNMHRGNEYETRLYAFLSVSFLCLVSVFLRTSWTKGDDWLKNTLRLVASYSYSLYLVHYTVIYMLSKFWTHGIGNMILAILLANFFSFEFYYFTERHYKTVGVFLKRMTQPLVKSNIEAT